MSRIDVHELLRGPRDETTRPKALFALHISKQPAVYVKALVEGLSSRERRVQGGCAELCSLLSEAEPGALAEHVDLFIAHLDAREPILRWEAVCTVGNLVSVDREGRIPKTVARITRFLDDESIVLQGHAVRALAKIAQAHPSTAAAILRALVASRDRFPGSRVGYLVEAMEAFTGEDRLRADARAFAECFVESDINPVRTKARRAMKKLASSDVAPAQVHRPVGRAPRSLRPARLGAKTR